MKVLSHMEVSGTLPVANQRAEPRPPLSWPLAVAVIGGLSVGLWVLVYRLAALLLRL